MRRIVAAGAGASLVLATIMAVNVAMASVASASPATTVVTASDLYGFSCSNVAPSGTGQFNVIDEISGCNHPSVRSSGGVSVVSTPGPSAQQGSLQLTVAGTNDHWAAFNYDNDGTSLSAITELSYSTYTSDGGPDTDPSLQLVIDPGSANSRGTRGRLPRLRNLLDTELRALSAGRWGHREQLAELGRDERQRRGVGHAPDGVHTRSVLPFGNQLEHLPQLLPERHHPRGRRGQRG